MASTESGPRPFFSRIEPVRRPAIHVLPLDPIQPSRSFASNTRPSSSWLFSASTTACVVVEEPVVIVALDLLGDRGRTAAVAERVDAVLDGGLVRPVSRSAGSVVQRVRVPRIRILRPRALDDWHVPRAAFAPCTSRKAWSSGMSHTLRHDGEVHRVAVEVPAPPHERLPHVRGGPAGAPHHGEEPEAVADGAVVGDGLDRRSGGAVSSPGCRAGSLSIRSAVSYASSNVSSRNENRRTLTPWR